jgi:hypothetical protein
MLAWLRDRGRTALECGNPSRGVSLACLPQPNVTLFPRWSDTALRVSLTLIALSALAVPVGLMIYVRTPYDQDRNDVVEQPVQFDHRHHVQDDGIECLYCHSGAERSASAGVPSTEVCMGCHSQVWNQSQLLQPLRVSFFTDRPIAWNRVHDLPDYVFFDHSVHVQAGVQCQRCHGDIETMPLVHRAKGLTMEFCLDCHRHPELNVSGYTRMRDRARPAAGSGLVDDTLLSCTACHR